MNRLELKRAFDVAQCSARRVGTFLKKKLHTRKQINHQSPHDIKLALDEESQRMIEQDLLKAFPEIAILGEEGVVGVPSEQWRWVVDPIDGTVNFSRGLPHACVSIALQQRQARANGHWDEYDTMLGVVYDPFVDEMWVARRGQKARLNGRLISVSDTTRLDAAIVSIGFAKSRTTVKRNLPVFMRLYQRVLKVRLLGSAALAMTWTAAGRLDAYRENGISIWDVAAGGLILECAGGEFWRKPLEKKYTYELIATNGLLRKAVKRLS